MTDTLEETAQQIADQGREALIARLRPAFQEAAAAHSDVLDLGPDQLDAMVERAVERADGLQWRRALASVATEQLGISLGEALGHPAVARAQELAGAPSYEESLAQLGPLPGVSAKPATEAGAPVTEADAPVTEADAPVTEAEAALADDPDAPVDEIDAPPGTGAQGTDEDETPDLVPAAPEHPSDHVESDDSDEALAALPDAGTLAPAPALPFADHDADTEYDAATELDLEDEYADEPKPPQSTDEYEALGPDEEYDEEYDEDDEHALRVAVIHLGGIANLAPAERNIELQMSEDGLDIVRAGGEILGRLDWDQVKALEVPTPRGRRRMRRGASTHLIVRTARGDASFEVPEVTPPELQQHLAPIVARHVRG